MQNAAADENEPCSFTTFVGYENSSTPLGQNWHRNVIFRNDRVVQRPITAIDMAVQPNESPLTGGENDVGVAPNYFGGFVEDVFPIPPQFVTFPLPERFWNALENDCLFNENTTPGEAEFCDMIIIPHNTNLGGGAPPVPPLFFDPFNAEDAARRQQFEPLVEIYQDKGSSECRYDPRFADKKGADPAAGVETIDEFCNFELLDTQSVLAAAGAAGSAALLPPSAFNPRAYVRNIWKDGLMLAQGEDLGGVNPFKMGVVASSDSHTGVMGFHPEDASWPGHLGIADLFPMAGSGSIQNSSGGHSVVWAEENTRNPIFDALQRKETYGTSGTRIVARFFGGWDVDFDEDLCMGNFVETGYDEGVPMGGDLPQMSQGATNPRFIVAAWKDDGPDGRNLEQIQIIKGWVDASGETHEEVLTVAGDPGDANDPQAGVRQNDCRTKRGGFERLCRVWEDEDFDADQAAFYYTRVLEEPVCRYSTLWCQERIGVNPLKPQQCQKDLDALANSDDPLDQLTAQTGALCCSNQTTSPIVQPAIQERAWTSPIWYTPAP